MILLSTYRHYFLYRDIALKRVILHHEQVHGFPLTTLREISLLKQLKHVNIVQLLDVTASDRKDSVYLVFEYCDFDFSGLLHDKTDPFNESQIKRLIIQLLSALQYLHENEVIHRDIKLSNLLYNSSGQLKLADFGLARKLTSRTRTLTPGVVTLNYRSPELLMNCASYDYSVDIWSAGCVIFELFTNVMLFSSLPGANSNTLAQLTVIFRVLGAPNASIWPELVDMQWYSSFDTVLPIFQADNPYNELSSQSSKVTAEAYEFLNRCLTYSPKKRITAKEALGHAYLNTMLPLPTEEILMPTFKKE